MSASVQIQNNFDEVYEKVKVFDLTQLSLYECWLIKHRSTGKNYALKVFSLNPRLWRLIETEGWVLNALTHPTIVRYYTTLLFEHNGNTHLGMLFEYVNGVSVAELVEHYRKTNQKIGVERMKKIMITLLEALSYIHSEYSLHNNLNPSTIVFTSKGIKIIGWGESCVKHQDHPPGKLLRNFECGLDRGFEGDVYDLGDVFDVIPYEKDELVSTIIQRMRSSHPPSAKSLVEALK